MKHVGIRSAALAAPAAALVLGLAGCITIEDDSTRMQQREDMLIVQEDTRKLDGRLEAVELEIQRLQQSVDAVRGQAAGQNQVQTMGARVDELDARLRGVEAAREKDKQEIIDKLSTQIAKIVGSSAKAGTAKKQPKRSASDTGYEHEVQPGETLSEIAAAYGVTVKVILDNNDIGDANRLRVGQKLFIPE